MSEYECPQCKQVYSGVQFLEDKFCRKCGKFLRPKYLKDIRVNYERKKTVAIESLELKRDQINVQTLFEEFLRLKDFYVGEGIVADDVPTWILDKRKAYKDFQKKFSKQEMSDLQVLHDNYKDFLYFKNNRSWTTLYRSGLKALNHLEPLRRLLTFLQDESIPIRERINQSLKDKYFVEGVGVGILTGLLHTFYPDMYGVWNSRSLDTLEIIRRKPLLSSDIGHSYLLINDELEQLKKELNTDLPTIDSFMWYISKRIKII